ncbi:MAG: Uncharacterized protein G01um101425_893 [Candidatus Peregrinibacteria bacterium Gr01-1014_25]|nr:MAG: Uncharacterized protein G01um101425_893 [Candidatus Peregrinibacteria bacterium Gr01-1014_25]
MRRFLCYNIVMPSHKTLLWVARGLACVGGLVPAIASAISFADCPSPCFTGGGILEGLGYASGIIGLLRGHPAFIAEAVITRLLVFLALIATIVITIAGLYLILGMGDETSRDRAKKIILYTAIGIFVVVFARLIVNIIFYLAGVENTNAGAVVEGVMRRVLVFVGILAVIAIVVAGLYLVLGFGDESARDKAKRIIFDVAIGIFIIVFAYLIVDFIFYLTGIGNGPYRETVQGVINRILVFLAIMALVAVIVAGLYLILGFGEESARDRAKRIIIDLIIGIFLIVFAAVIVDFIFYLAGIGSSNLAEHIEAIINRILAYLILLGIIAIIVAGFYLILSLGDEASKDRAKRIIIYTIIGILLVVLAREIVSIIFYLVAGQGSDAGVRSIIVTLVRRVLNFVALIAVIVIIIAGFVLILSLGDEQQKDRAKRIIYYCIAGMLVILFARIIVEFVVFLGRSV